MNKKIDKLIINNKTYVFDTPLILEYEKTDEWGECYVNDLYQIVIPFGINIDNALSEHFSILIDAYINTSDPLSKRAQFIANNIKKLLKI